MLPSSVIDAAIAYGADARSSSWRAMRSLEAGCPARRARHHQRGGDHASAGARKATPSGVRAGLRHRRRRARPPEIAMRGALSRCHLAIIEMHPDVFARTRRVGGRLLGTCSRMPGWTRRSRGERDRRTRPRLRPSQQGLIVLLVDSHCHLDFPDFAEERDAVVARARRGRRRPHGDDLDAGEALSPACLAIAEAHRRGLLLGRHASAQCRRGARRHGRRTGPAVGASEGGGDRRGRARLLLRQVAARRAGAGLSHAISRRRARPACRWSSMRATPTTTWRRSSRTKAGRGPSRSSCTAFRPAASWPRPASRLAATSRSPAS